MRVVLDTNVLVSAVLFGGTARAVFQRLLRGELEAVTTPRLLGELEDVLVELGLPSDLARLARTEYEQIAIVVRPDNVPRVSRDRDDDEVLAAASAGQATTIVTGDKDLLTLREHEGVAIVTLKGFAASLG